MIICTAIIPIHKDLHYYKRIKMEQNQRKTFNWVLPKKIENRIGVNSYGRQRTIFEEEHLLIILHDLPKVGEKSRDPYVFLRQPEGHFFCNGNVKGETALTDIIQRYIDRFLVLDEEYNESDSAESYFKILEEVIIISRSATNLYQTLQKAREHVMADKFILEMRDAAAEMHRNFELLLMDVKNALDYTRAKSSERQAMKAEEAVEAQHRLNILVALFFPLMTVATIFGMNLVHGFEKQATSLFWAVLSGGLLLGLFLMRWVMKKSK